MINIKSIKEVFPSITRVPRILLWDVETAKMLLHVETYSLKQYSSYLRHQDIVRDIWMLCAAWKWLGDPYIASTSVLNDPERFEADYADDFHVISMLHHLVSQADILVAHNGDNFDWKIFTSRCIVHDLDPPPKPLMIDTLKVARREFKFSSNSLSYLCRHLGIEDKMEAPNWGAIAKGDAEAIAEAEAYCRGDIRSLEALYLKLRPYITNHPNIALMTDGVHHMTCPKCGHWDLKKFGVREFENEGLSRQYVNGFKYTGAGKYQRYKCAGCGGQSYAKKNLKKVELK